MSGSTRGSKVVAGALAFLLGTASRGATQSVPPVLKVTAQVTISADTENLSRIGAVAIGPRGLVALAQPQDRTVVVFDSSGTRRFSFGRRGGGPGEFESVAKLGWVGDTLWVFDRTSRRITLVSPAGRLGRAWSMTGKASPDPRNPDSRFMQLQPQSVMPGNSLVAFGTLPLAAPAGGFETWVVVLSPEGAVSRRLVRLPEDPCFRRSAQAQVRLSVCGSPMTEVSPDGQLIATLTPLTGAGETGAYQLAIRDGRGVARWTRQSRVPLARLSSGLRDTLRSAIDSASPPVAALLRASPLPSHHPAATALVVGGDGTLWVRLGARDPSGRSIWEVWGSQGTLLGRAQLAPNVFPLAVSAGLLVAKRETDEGFQDVVRFHVR